MMSRALVLGAAALAFSAGSALADGSAEPGPPVEGYAVPAPPPVYTAPPVYAAPVYTAPTVIYTAPTIVYTGPPVYAVPKPLPAPLPSHPIFAFAPGYRHGWHGHWHGWH
jgi:hypothetical protein